MAKEDRELLDAIGDYLEAKNSQGRLRTNSPDTTVDGYAERATQLLDARIRRLARAEVDDIARRML